jgi:hypothetical protein
MARTVWQGQKEQGKYALPALFAAHGARLRRGPLG